VNAEDRVLGVFFMGVLAGLAIILVSLPTRNGTAAIVGFGVTAVSAEFMAVWNRFLIEAPKRMQKKTSGAPPPEKGAP